MAYINSDYYINVFQGTQIPDSEFYKIAEAASLMIDEIAIQKIPIVDGEVSDNVKKAVAYQAEMIYMQGGTGAYTGNSIYETATHETLDDYSIIRVGNITNAQSTTNLLRGVPISPFVDTLLRKDGLMNRWAYYGAE